MVEDWENLVIETGVDSLLNYLAENGKASAGEISGEIGIEKSRVSEWADALEEENLIEKHHTMRSGLVLEYNKKNIEETERKKEEIEMDLDEESKEIRDRLKKGSELVEEKRNALLESEYALEENEKEIVVEDTVVRLENLEQQIDEQIDENQLDHDTLKLIEEAERVLKEVETLIKKRLTPEQGQKLDKKADSTVAEVREVLDMAQNRDEFVEDEQEIRKHMKAIKKLEKNIEKAKSRERNQQNRSAGLFGKIKSMIPVKKGPKRNSDNIKSSNKEIDEVSESEGNKLNSFEPVDIEIKDSDKIKQKDFPEQTYQELVDENRVTEVMRKISLIKNPDYEGLLRAEQHNRNRDGLINYLEERVEDVRG